MIPVDPPEDDVTGEQFVIELGPPEGLESDVLPMKIKADPGVYSSTGQQIGQVTAYFRLTQEEIATLLTLLDNNYEENVLVKLSALGNGLPPVTLEMLETPAPTPLADIPAEEWPQPEPKEVEFVSDPCPVCKRSISRHSDMAAQACADASGYDPYSEGDR